VTQLKKGMAERDGLLDDDGLLGEARTRAAIDAVLVDRPTWKRLSPSFDGPHL
jgi:hypothetical protein